MGFKRVSAGLFSSSDVVLTVAKENLRVLADEAAKTVRRRARLCVHKTPTEPVQEMLIALHHDTFVPPHRHRNKIESFHLVEGRVDVVIFSDEGAVKRVVPLGPYSSGEAFFFQNREKSYHTIVVSSRIAMIHETTNGPFVQGRSTIVAPWAPEETDTEACKVFLARLRREINNWKRRGKS